MKENSPTGVPVREIRWIDTSVIVRIAGEIDLNVSQEFQHELLKLLDKHPRRVIIDLSDVSYMDSSGVASLVKLLSRSRRFGASLILVALTERVRSVFEITRLDSVFDIRSTQEEALA